MNFQGGVPMTRFVITDKVITITKTGAFFKKHVTTIPMRNVASWEGTHGAVKIRTNDGKTHSLPDMHPDKVIAALEETIS